MATLPSNSSHRLGAALAPILVVLLCFLAASGPVSAEEPEVSAAASPQPDTIASERIVDVRVDCSVGVCRKPAEQEALIRIAGLEEGTLVSAEGLAAARQNLLALGAFASVEIELEAAPGGAALTYVLEPGRVIRKIFVCPGGSLGDEIRRRLFVRSGQILEEPHEALLERQAEILDDYLQRQGFFGNTIHIMTLEDAVEWQAEHGRDSLCGFGRVVYRRATRARHLERRVEESTVDLVVHVRRGERQRLAGIYVRGNEALTFEEIRDILLGRFSLLLTVTSERLREAADAVLEEYRNLGYLQARFARLDVHVDDGEVSLYLDIREGPHWQISFEGNALLSSRELLSSLPFYETGFIDAEEIALAELNLLSRYETRGYPAARISHHHHRDDEDNEVLTFFIDEQGWGAVRSIEFVGLPDDIDPALLRAEMSTREYSALSTAGVLQRSLLERDLRAIESTLQELGHAAAQVTELEVERSADGRDINLLFHVAPGPRFTVGEVSVEGWPEEAGSRWQDLERSLQPGGVFNARWLAEDQDVLERALGGAGYIEVQGEASCVDEAGAQIACLPALFSAECRRSMSGLTLPERARTRVAQQRGERLSVTYPLVLDDDSCAPEVSDVPLEVRVQHSVTTGPRVRFGDVLWRGLHHTRLRVVRRELAFSPGDLYDANALLETQRRLRYIGLFSSVRVQPVARRSPAPDEEASMAPVVIQVEETGYRTIEHRIGLQTVVTSLVDPLVTLGNQTVFRERNIAGSGSELRLEAELDLDIIDRARVRDGELDAALRAIYFMPRLWLFGLRRAPWEGRLTIYHDRELLSIPPLPLRKEVGTEVLVRQEFRRFRGLFLELGAHARYVDALDQGEAQITPEFESSFILSVIPRISLERRDNPLHPSSGFFFDTSVELATGILTFVDSEQYLKVSTRGSVYFPLSEVFTLALGTRLGASAGLGEAGKRAPGGYLLPVSERFALGGITTLRGFREGEIRVAGRDDYGGDFMVQGSVELRYPFLAAQNIFGAIFLDHGALGRVPADIRMDAFRTSTGFGVRWLIADLIPIVLDYGFVLNRRPGESTSMLQFNVGYTF